MLALMYTTVSRAKLYVPKFLSLLGRHQLSCYATPLQRGHSAACTCIFAPGTSPLFPKTFGMLRGCQSKIFPLSQPETCSRLGYGTLGISHLIPNRGDQMQNDEPHSSTAEIARVSQSGTECCSRISNSYWGLHGLILNDAPREEKEGPAAKPWVLRML